MPAPSKQQTLTLDQALSLGIKHHTTGKLNEAEDIYQQILRPQPNHPTALHNLGLIAHQVGKNDIGLELIQKALSIKEDYAEAHSNLSVIFLQLGKLKKRKCIAKKR